MQSGEPKIGEHALGGIDRAIGSKDLGTHDAHLRVRVQVLDHQRDGVLVHHDVGIGDEHELSISAARGHAAG